MTLATLATWHELVESRNANGLNALLADNVVFYSPVVYAPQVGKAITLQYLSAAFVVLSNESFRYVREITGPRDAALEFQVEIEGINVNESQGYPSSLFGVLGCAGVMWKVGRSCAKSSWLASFWWLCSCWAD